MTRVFKFIPVVALLFASVFSPLLLFAFPSANAAEEASRPDSRIFWIGLSGLCLYCSLNHRVPWGEIRAPAFAWMAAYLILAGVSCWWSADTALTFKRVVQQLLVVACVLMPVLQLKNTRWLLDAVFISFVIVVFLNIAFLFVRPPTMIGHAGIYTHKNTLGEVAGLIFVFGLYKLVEYDGFRRLLAAAVSMLAVLLLVASQSKTALGLALITPILAGVIVGATTCLRVPQAVCLAYLAAFVVGLYTITAAVMEFQFNDFLMLVFNDPTFTGRTYVWSFASEMIARRPLLGWGYQSFWLTGAGSPSAQEAPYEWIIAMPHAHNGYIDILLNNGFIGLFLTLGFIAANLKAVERCIIKNPRLGFGCISIIIFVILNNSMETTIFRGFSTSWISFLLIVGVVNFVHDPRSKSYRSVKASPLPRSDLVVREESRSDGLMR